MSSLSGIINSVSVVLTFLTDLLNAPPHSRKPFIFSLLNTIEICCKKTDEVANKSLFDMSKSLTTGKYFFYILKESD